MSLLTPIRLRGRLTKVINVRPSAPSLHLLERMTAGAIEKIGRLTWIIQANINMGEERQCLWETKALKVDG
jgi:hypothetical protein